MKKKTLITLFLCMFIIIASLIIGKNGKFGGADGQIQSVIGDMDSSYHPWVKSFWTPPSGEIESLLFALQAAIGAGFIGYYIGRKQNVQTDKHTIKKQ
ncbi:energy-coupling factor ABC transporter substrate-binding protein [Clostridium sp.]|uniref:energy-coupling factor ABC transporter substrate-binding protein n=1 Tax=Clostridium sp. TaxID=1506 RepID=UPI001A63CA3C|nr:energy-coupling factor ABC transporter substrate-binding protein [Clostridium sp.]MBK5235348.1 energy-coupling factor ABC transporter substrate-binding protein [Clostridium sp.]